MITYKLYKRPELSTVEKYFAILLLTQATFLGILKYSAPYIAKIKQSKYEECKVERKKRLQAIKVNITWTTEFLKLENTLTVLDDNISMLNSINEHIYLLVMYSIAICFLFGIFLSVINNVFITLSCVITNILLIIITLIFIRFSNYSFKNILILYAICLMLIFLFTIVSIFIYPIGHVEFDGSSITKITINSSEIANGVYSLLGKKGLLLKFENNNLIQWKHSTNEHIADTMNMQFYQ